MLMKPLLQSDYVAKSFKVQDQTDNVARVQSPILLCY